MGTRMEAHVRRYSNAFYNLGFSPVTDLLYVHHQSAPKTYSCLMVTQDRGFYSTPSFSVDAAMCSIVRKVDALHEEIRQTFGAVAAGV